MTWQSLLQFNTPSLGWPSTAGLVFLHVLLSYCWGCWCQFFLPSTSWNTAIFLTGEQTHADRKSSPLHIHITVCQQGWLPIVLPSCKEFIFPGQQCCATQVAGGTVGLIDTCFLVENYLWCTWHSHRHLWPLNDVKVLSHCRDFLAFFCSKRMFQY